VYVQSFASPRFQQRRCHQAEPLKNEAELTQCEGKPARS
jgi:hypothetical protein